tara:strand:+ start:22476 stop:23723 length:1248 start_codon:yes stop_codon:yes gene_type:complete
MLNSILNKRVKETPDKIFITYKNRRICFSVFNSMVNNYYEQLKTKKNEYVGLQINDKLKLLVAIIALNKKQSIPVVYPDHPSLEDFILTTNIPISIKNFDISDIKNNLPASDEHNVHNTQMVIFTSGSTGKQKPCEITYNNLYESAKIWDRIIKFKNTDIYLNHMPLTHVSGLCIFFRALYCNFEMILDDFSVENYFKYSKKINLVSMVSTMLDKILNSSKDIRFETMKSVIIGGDNINIDLIDKIKMKKIPAYISYGLTESCSGIAGSWVDEYQKNLIYSAHKRVKINLSNKMLEISSPTIIKKYFNSQKVFNNRFTTSDIVEIVSKNKFKFKYRADDIVISGGENISIMYVNKILMQFEEINSCSIEVIVDKRWGQTLHAKLAVDKKLDVIKFKRKLKNHLPGFMIPKKISFI